MYPSPCSPRSHAGPTDPARRAGVFLGFSLHLAAYVVGVAAMVAINLAFWSGYFWAVWPMMGWGIGVFSHGAGVARMAFDALAREGAGHRPDGAAARLGGSPGGRDTVTLSEQEWGRVVRRIEHLEAIVTSEAWEANHHGRARPEGEGDVVGPTPPPELWPGE